MKSELAGGVRPPRREEGGREGKTATTARWASKQLYHNISEHFNGLYVSK